VTANVFWKLSDMWSDRDNLDSDILDYIVRLADNINKKREDESWSDGPILDFIIENQDVL
jgi:hypothetical protein